MVLVTVFDSMFLSTDIHIKADYVSLVPSRSRMEQVFGHWRRSSFHVAGSVYRSGWMLGWAMLHGWYHAFGWKRFLEMRGDVVSTSSAALTVRAGQLDASGQTDRSMPRVPRSGRCSRLCSGHGRFAVCEVEGNANDSVGWGFGCLARGEWSL